MKWANVCTKHIRLSLMIRLTAAVLSITAASIGILFADEWDSSNEEHRNAALLETVKRGEEIFQSSELGGNTVQCAMCHPNTTNTHPETYPKFQKRLGRVATLREMINWCIQNSLEAKPLAHDDPKMISIEAYIVYERRNAMLVLGKH